MPIGSIKAASQNDVISELKRFQCQLVQLKPVRAIVLSKSIASSNANWFN